MQSYDLKARFTAVEPIIANRLIPVNRCNHSSFLTARSNSRHEDYSKYRILSLLYCPVISVADDLDVQVKQWNSYDTVQWVATFWDENLHFWLPL